ncbi:MAG: threonine--tRNA ligase [Candidatus Aenigmarchaeota archaeon]|nr:threonine--tRNA ligase [Candidatus Aenigmarchaeota archaeon]
MKILLTHVDYIEYEAKKKAIESAEPLEEEKQRIEECLVAFCSAEEGDDESVVQKTADEISKVAKQVNTKTVVVYPFVHLTSRPAKPQTALEIVKKIEALLRNDYEVHRAPFGWYKSFELKSKGHPLSELSREIMPGKQLEIKKIQQKISKKPEKPQEAKELAPNDHRILGNQLDLYSFQEYAPGMTFFHPKGMIIRNQLAEFWRSEHRKHGYKEIFTPLIMNNALWHMSGHWDHYKDNMFFTKIDDTDFAVKPMNCPGAILVFKNSTRSYRDLPMRLAELGQVHRNELSGVLSGMFRLRYFTQDDAHIFVTEDQIEDEVMRVVDVIDHFYKTFGFEYHVELSTRPDDFMGSKNVWDKAEKALEEALKKRGMSYKINPGDGAFYGPKIDFHLKDSLGRTWQCATVQVDFQMPERFDINYVGEDGSQHKPVIIHRVIYGAIERFMGILVEHYNGAFPLWLSPIQVRVLSLTDRNAEAAKEVWAKLFENDIRAEIDLKQSTVDHKIREAEMQKVNYIVVIGDKEQQTSTLAVRPRGDKPQFGVRLDEFLAKLRKDIENKK